MRNRLKIAILLLALVLGIMTQDCSTVSEASCGVSGSPCPYHTWVNGSCLLLTSCPSDTIFLNSTNNCLQCEEATENQCTDCDSFNYYFNTDQELCLKCSLSYGSACVACDTAGCSECSNSLTLSSDNQSCVDSSCDITFCTACSNSTHCQTCDSSYVLVDNMCICKVDQCELCSQAYCDKCFDGYQYNSARTQCSLICLDNCLQCVTPINTNCITPAFGYVYQAGKMVLDCSLINVNNCSVCQSFTTCTLCVSGFELNPSGTECIEQCTDDNCISCSANISVCEQCATGYFVENNGCSLAFCSISDCLTCATSTTCQDCATLFSLAKSDTECQPTCIGEEPHCVKCATQTTCSICESGFTENSGTCQPICSISGCSICKSSTTCKKCQSGRQLSQTSTSCDWICNIPGCITCSSTTTCSLCNTGFNRVNNTCQMQCGIGFYYNVNTCTKCPTSKCQSCGTNGVCNLCARLYYLNQTTFSCLSCDNIDPNCFDCLPGGAACTKCDTGYKLTTSTTCVEIATISCTVGNCTTCVVDDPTTCSDCADGYELQPDGTCQEVMCLGDLFEMNGECTCGSGAYALNNLCYPCENKCTSCTSTACLSCRSGNYVSGTSCVSCPRRCATCTSLVCLTCKRGFNLESGECRVRRFRRIALAIARTGRRVVCPTGCESCDLDIDGNIACSEASEGYVLIDGDTLENCDPRCKTCSSTINPNTNTYSTCITCFEGFVARTGSCIKCTDIGALTCSVNDAAYSITCRRTYTVRSGDCLACADHCLTCDTNGAGSCDKNGCRPGYNQIGSDPSNILCTSCFNGCYSCDSGDPNNCLDCGDRRYVSGGTCQDCPSRCIECSDGTTCTSCEAGYEVAGDGSCQQPPGPPCTEYDSSLICTGCDVNYDLVDDTCILNLSCNNTSTCTTCNFNFYLQSGQCFQCPSISNCQACNPNNKDVCFLCNQGFYLDGSNTCQSCETGCAVCDSSNWCTEAEAGFYLESSSSGEDSGTVGQCTSPCSECEVSGTTCLDCEPGYDKTGTKCISQNKFGVRLIVVAKQIVNRANVTEGEELGVTFRRLGSFIRQIGNRIGFNDDNTRFERSSNFKRIARSSVDVEFDVNSDGITDPGTTLSTATFTDFDMVSSSSTSNTSTSSDNSINLALVLGVAIPLLILIIAIIIIVKVKSGDEVTPDTADGQPGWSEKEMEFYDNQVEM